ncbi:itaconyl-CoA hydratase, partial [Achromobacter xylosoxidans]
PTPPKHTATDPAPQPHCPDTLEPTAVLLFPNTAVTFTGHRIPSDDRFETDTEGKAGLVVHGAKIATEMVAAFLRAQRGARPTHVSYRGLRPLISPTPLQVGRRVEETAHARLWRDHDRTLADHAELRFTARSRQPTPRCTA